jgi:cation diffusion facilitator family transporter
MKEKIAGLSVIANFVLAVGKIIAGFLTSSASIMAEGIHSGMDILSSGISLIGIKIAKKPVDKKHPYGHYKFEVLSGLVITFILFVTGLWIIYEAYQSYRNPLILNFGYFAFGIMLFSAVVNEVMARLKIHYGKKENSISLLSDGIHSRVDVWTSLAVLIGLILNKYWIYTDALLALFIGLYIIKESFELGKEATDSLLDISAGDKVEEEIKKIAEENKIKISDLKTQKKGSVVTANLEINLPSTLKIDEATKISKKLKKELIEKIDVLEYVVVQIEGTEISESYYKSRELVSSFGKGFGWQKKGRFKDTIKEARGEGPEGFCICEECDYRIKHKVGVPCSTIKCPKCGRNMTRENGKTKKT